MSGERNAAQMEGGREPTLLEAIAVIAVAAVLVAMSVRYWETDVHIALVLSATVAAAVALFVLKFPWKVIEEGMLASILMGMQAILILCTVGMLIGTWLLSGVVQTMIYYGLAILNPNIFLIATLLICSIVSLATGTSWGTAGTVGIALMGIAAGLGVPDPVAAGFIISGAYFGDKMSPLSDTTNLAPAMAGTDIFQHIRAMAWTTIPSYSAVIVIAGVMGMGYSSNAFDTEKVRAIQDLMKVEFFISPLGLIPPILVIGLAACGKPALPSIFSGALAGIAFGLFQGASFGTILDVMQNGYTPDLPARLADLSENVPELLKLMAENGLSSFSTESITNAAAVLKELLARGGLQSMMWTNSLIICALVFGGVLDRCGFLQSILRAMMSRVRTVGGYIFAVSAACLFTNMVASDQYIALVLPGRMFKSAFDKKGLHPRMLSRVLEDTGTITSAIVPWNTCGAYQSNTLGVPTLQYLPYAFFNYLNPIVGIVMAYMGIGIAWRGKDGEPVIAKTRPAGL
ncbi:MAG: Na+/H+ antiporter NhaC [Synergistaceae bacterium]|jgi:NhaC family Na+:H+ antiporter|nr:Na+/H+ antiporter NhaC [Synergistaceae bacterium]